MTNQDFWNKYCNTHLKNKITFEQTVFKSLFLCVSLSEYVTDVVNLSFTGLVFYFIN